VSGDPRGAGVTMIAAGAELVYVARPLRGHPPACGDRAEEREMSDCRIPIGV
jgi:hypothetical protein